MFVDMCDSLLSIANRLTFRVCCVLLFSSSDDDFEEIDFGSGSEPEVKLRILCPKP